MLSSSGWVGVNGRMANPMISIRCSMYGFFVFMGKYFCSCGMLMIRDVARNSQAMICCWLLLIRSCPAPMKVIIKQPIPEKRIKSVRICFWICFLIRRFCCFGRA